ncbi:MULTISPECIES: hypothetical protein [Enterobacter]|uniref:hypothetical protein n=1 Tax=Enterobacter TaxID=547 RepID=UPI000D1D4FD9|nr:MULTISPECIES: hypothetical protein [Enterobacter]MBJ6383719.1 hypothetical protein [Enterobacter cloacae]MBJ6405819.1 hypothetical protein [Enterobacter cloacae]MBJ6432109.1 hypothetical protein [Enterobacter cloacae]MBJ6456604.1 hypothetical protein [Enterobacter cloacae]MBJ6488234.1 hypothetical protein [Enterobacter cloacae]
MSVFIIRKDRDRHGKPLPNAHIGYPGCDGKMAHYADLTSDNWPDWNTVHNSSAWNSLYHTRPRRASDRQNLKRVMQGADPDGLFWHRDNRPYIYCY